MRSPRWPAKSLVWFAAMAPAFIGIIALVTNIAYAFRIYVALQRATDAACEAAAVMSVDKDHFVREGEIRLISSRAQSVAAQVFARTMMSVNAAGAFGLSVHQDLVLCQATARIPLIVKVPGLSDFQVVVRSASRARGIHR